MENLETNQVLVTFVVPVYNTQDYLSECIDSILSIRGKNYEILIIDDGSTDESRSICERYLAHDNIHLFSQSNKGVSAARNVGIENAKGKYITFVDSDDKIRISDLSFLNSNKDLYCLGMKRFTENTEIKIRFKQGDDIYKQFVKYPAYMNSMCNKFFKYKLILDNKLKIDEEQKYREDMLFVVSALEVVSSIEYLDIDYYYYRTNMQSASKKLVTKEIIKNNMESADKIINIIREKSKELCDFLTIAPAMPLLSDVNCFDYVQYKERVNTFLVWIYSKNVFYTVISLFAALGMKHCCELVIYLKKRR